MQYQKILVIGLCLLISMGWGATSQAQTVDPADSLVLINILDQNCNGCSLKDPNSFYYWDTLDPVTSWTGIGVANNRIHSLKIIQAGLSGTLAPLSTLSRLTWISLPHNAISGLPSLDSLPVLDSVDISHNVLTSLPNLDQCDSLNWLNCGNNLLQQLPALDSCSALRGLFCGDNVLDSLPDLQGCPNLELLVCDSNQLTQLPELNVCPQLRSLSCTANLLTDLPNLDSCTQLDTLRCDHNLLDTLPCLDQCNPLNTLDVSSNALNFLHLEPNAFVPSFFYSGQAPLALTGFDSLVVFPDTSFLLNASGTGRNNQYRWYYDSIGPPNPNLLSPRSTDSTYRATKTGWYVVAITNSVVTGISISSKLIYLEFSDPVKCGDSNRDQERNMLDLAMLGLNYGKTGPKRPNGIANNLLQGAYSWRDTNGTYSVQKLHGDTLNLKHADCDGNGIINELDMGCIQTYYGRSHNRNQYLSDTINPGLSLQAKPRKSQIEILPGQQDTLLSVPFDIHLEELPAGIDSLKVRGIIFTRPVTESPHFEVRTTWANFDNSDFIQDSARALWMQKYHPGHRILAGDSSQACTIDTNYSHPLDVGVFHKDSAIILRRGDNCINCIVLLEDCMKPSNYTPVRVVDSLPLMLSTLNVIVYAEDPLGNPVTIAGKCSQDTTYINADSLLRAYRPPLSQQGYALDSVVIPCSQDTFSLCLTATDSVGSGMWGLGYCLEYDTNAVRPTGNYTLGPVVTNPGGFSAILDTSQRGTVYAGIFLGGSTISYLSGTGDLICLEFEVLNAAVDTHYFPVCDLTQSFDPLLNPTASLTVTLDSGKVRIVPNDTLNGQVYYWGDTARSVGNQPGTPLGTVAAGLLQSGNCTSFLPLTEPDSTGAFQLQIPVGRNAVEVRRDVPNANAVMNVINAADANRVFGIWTGSYPNPNIYELLAADADGDGRILVGDMSAINARSVLSRLEFVGVDDWRFVTDSLLNTPSYLAADKNNVPFPGSCFPVVANQNGSCAGFENMLFQGILTGDVDGNWSTQDQATLKTAGSDHFEIRLNEMSALGANGYRLPVYLLAANPVTGADLDLDFDPAQLAVTDVEPSMLFNNQIRFMDWNSFQNERLFLTAGMQSGWMATSPFLYLEVDCAHPPTASDLGVIQGYMDGKAVPIEIVENTGTGVTMEEGLPQVEVFPNPIHDQLVIRVDRWEGKGLTAMIYNAMGQEVVRFSVTGKETKVELSGLPAGVYSLSIGPGPAYRLLKE